MWKIKIVRKVSGPVVDCSDMAWPLDTSPWLKYSSWVAKRPRHIEREPKRDDETYRMRRREKKRKEEKERNRT